MTLTNKALQRDFLHKELPLPALLVPNSTEEAPSLAAGPFAANRPISRIRHSHIQKPGVNNVG